MKAAARVIYRSSWATDRPAIMQAHGWETSNSEVLIRRERSHSPRAVQSRRSPRARFLCSQHPSALWKNVFVSCGASGHALLAAHACPGACAALPSSARAWRWRRASRLVRRRVSSPLVRLLTNSPCAQSSFRPRVARAASCSSGLSSGQPPPNRACWVLASRSVLACQVCQPCGRQRQDLRVQPGGVPVDCL